MTPYSTCNVCVLACLAVFATTHAARILGFFPSQSKSNLLVHCSIAKTLAANGHNVTVIGTMPNVYPRALYHYIELKVPSFDPSYIKKSVQQAKPIYRQYYSLMKQVTALAANILEQPQMKHLMATAHQSDYDLLILGYFINDYHLGLASLYQCPIIVSSTVRPTYATNGMVGNPLEHAYVPSTLTEYTQPLDFLQRVWNFLITLYKRFVLSWLVDRTMEKYFCAYFACEKVSLSEVRKNISLVFTNHHFSQGPIRANVPAMIEIGGIQIPEEVSSLPADIAAHLDNAIHGAILVSFGSNIECNSLPYEKALIMFEVFAKLKFHVLWKWGNCLSPGKSPNILYRNWFPQNDILAHPNLKLFVTHGGLGSITESLYHGVPMLGLPFFGDQPGNMEVVQRRGYGRWLNYKQLSLETFRRGITEITDEPSYQYHARNLSKIYRDRPLTARQTVNFWVNYVLRHNGGKHMRSPAADMYQYELLGLDLFVFILLIPLLLALGTWILFKRMTGKKQRMQKQGLK